MNKRRILICIVGSLVFFALAARHNGTLVALRGRYNLDLSDPLRNAPPSVVFTTVALGGFRGLVADVLWLRASYLQEKGDIFELVQLSDWITRLEPHCTEIWAFHAWNMAYNVSAMVSKPEDRWRWVRSGISLLRDQGIRYNGGDPQLFFELSWLFKNKIGHAMDRDNMYFKKRWAEEMTALLGGAAPAYAALSTNQAAVARMREEYGLDPAIMRSLDRAYGPFDWRLPSAHSAYWAHRGSLVAGQHGSLACERMFFQSLSDMFYEGELVFRPEDNLFMTVPRIDILPGAIKAFEETMARRREKSVQTAYRNFLRDSTLLLYTFGGRDLAQANLDLLCRRFPNTAESTAIEPFVSANIDVALRRATRERLIAFTEGFFYQEFVWRATGDGARSAAAEAMARRCWNEYLKDKPAEVLAKLGLPDIEQVRLHARRRASRDLPPSLSSSLTAEPSAGEKD
jgi:hypothetical protein